MTKSINTVTNPWESANYIVYLAKTKPLHLVCLILAFGAVCVIGCKIGDWTYHNAIEQFFSETSNLN